MQQELQLFQPAAFEDLFEEKGISGLTVIFNSRIRKSWHMRTRNDGRRILVVPALLEHAPVEIKNAILSWACMTKPRQRRMRKDYYSVKKQLEREVWRYLESQGVSSRRALVANPDKFLGDTRGCVFDLKDIFNSVNIRCFGNSITSHIRWGSALSKTSYQARYRDAQGNGFSVITIAGIYDHPDVPRFALEAVMFHEMLHVALPPYMKNGRRIIHGPEFRNAQVRYPDYEPWRLWEKRDLPGIASAKKRKKK
jgi:hypothetical protein